MPTVSCLAVSGSLRRASTNTRLLEAAASLAPAGMNFTIYRGLGDLQHFNPDIDPEQTPPVRSWIDQVREAQGFIVSTPEYAHGLPGSLKNALDWLVGSDAFVNKPFMLLNASSRSAYAHDSLVEILSTMSGVHIRGASASIPLLGTDPAAIDGLIRDKYAELIRTSLGVFARTIRDNPKADEMLKLVRTDSNNADFVSLVKFLDADLAIRDGADHAFYSQFNTIDKIKYVVLAYEEGVPVGCGAIKEYDPKTMEVKRMYVPPTARKRGIAAKVLAELEKWAGEMGCERCVLETGKKQPEAIALYTRNGYTLIPNYGQYVGVDTSVCFEKQLT